MQIMLIAACIPASSPTTHIRVEILTVLPSQAHLISSDRGIFHVLSSYGARLDQQVLGSRQRFSRDGGLSRLVQPVYI
jgi:hypothetical protein